VHPLQDLLQLLLDPDVDFVVDDDISGHQFNVHSGPPRFWIGADPGMYSAAII